MITNESATWRYLITSALYVNGESWDDVVSKTLDDQQLDEKFDSGYGVEEGVSFTLWTNSRVYFPVCYDGAEWVGSVSRHPDGKPTEHIGG